MELVLPGIGLMFWMTLAFVILLILLGKFAWKPILASLKAREESIQNALDAAERAKDEMARLESNIEDLKKEAREERDQMMKDARDTRDKIVADAKAKAQDEADRIVAQARESIQNERMAAVSDLKNQVANLSIEIAERLLQEKLGDDAKQKELMDNLMKEVQLN